jgi:hypothetical protein
MPFSMPDCWPAPLPPVLLPLPPLLPMASLALLRREDMIVVWFGLVWLVWLVMFVVVVVGLG